MKSILPKAVRELTQEFQKLPGVGPKTAQRLAIHLLRQPPGVVAQFAQSMRTLHERVKICRSCFNLAEREICDICQEPGRDRTLLCIVEDPLDVEAIERTGSYQGLYHVLGGVLSPLEGVGVEQLTLREMADRVKEGQIGEIIVALDQTMEAEATTRYIRQAVAESGAEVTRLARGLPTGGDIEYADSLTLNAAFEGRK